MAGNQEYVCTTFDETARNYSYNYDKDMFTSLWVAYPLWQGAITGSNSAGWKGDPNIPDEYEVNIRNHSYGVNVGSTTKEGYDEESYDFYARGHQIPNADRKASATMNSQTYYVTNSTPQMQKGFNSSVWSSLETAIRNTIPASDTLYVATGAAFNKVGESKDITWILPRDEEDPDRTCPVPNYYWKVLLKVKRDSGGNVTSAGAVGFWFEHKAYTGASYADHAVSVDQIEQWTGFDFFVNLPDSVEKSAETNSSWDSFRSF